MPKNPFEGRAPWQPGAIRSSARAFAQWLTAVVGASHEQVVKRLVQTAAITPQLAGRLANNAVSFMQTIANTFQGNRDDQMPRSNIPRNADLPNAYRVVVNVRYRDPLAPSTARGRDAYEYRTIVLDFSANPTWEMIEGASRAFAVQKAIAGSDPKRRQVMEWKINKIEVIMIERRT